MQSSTRSTKRNYNKIILAGVLLVVALLFYKSYHDQLIRERDYVLVKVQPIQTQFGWGYEVVWDGKPYIHQEFIPCIRGRRGFDSKEDAVRVGDRVVEKMKKKIVPPAINLKDLEELGILKPADTAQIRK